MPVTRVLARGGVRSCGAGFDGEGGQAPFEHAVGEPLRAVASGGQEADGVVGQDAVGTAAVGDHLGVGGQFGKARLRLVEGMERAPGMRPAAYSSAGRTSTTVVMPGLDPVRQLFAGELVGVVGTGIGGTGLVGGHLVYAGDPLQ